MRPGMGEGRNRVTRGGVGGSPPAHTETNSASPPSLPAPGCGREPPLPLPPPGQAVTPKSFIRTPAAAKLPGIRRRGGCWVTSSRPSTPFPCPSSLFFNFPGGVFILPNSTVLVPRPLPLLSPVPQTEGRSNPFWTPLSCPRGRPRTYSLPFLYRAGAFISTGSPFFTSGVVPRPLHLGSSIPYPNPHPTPGLPLPHGVPSSCSGACPPPPRVFAGGSKQSGTRPSPAPAPSSFSMESTTAQFPGGSGPLNPNFFGRRGSGDDRSEEGTTKERKGLGDRARMVVQGGIPFKVGDPTYLQQQQESRETAARRAHGGPGGDWVGSGRARPG